MSSSSWSVFLTPTVDTRNLCATGPPAFGATTDPEEDAGETIIGYIMTHDSSQYLQGSYILSRAEQIPG